MPSDSVLTRIRRFVTDERRGGALLLASAVVAVVWANTPWRATYATVVGAVPGGDALAGVHLDLTLATWASDGLLAIFFFVVGLELKQEVVAGSLRDPRRAAVPVLAAVGGMAAPAVLYVATTLLDHDGGARAGWAVPTATDIAFALAVLAVFGRGLPTPVRTFLLTLAVVDDLLAIVIIAFVLTAHVAVGALLGGLACVVAFGVVARLRRAPWWLLVPLAVAAWALVHASGVHATIAGVLLGFAVPTRAVHGELVGRAERAEHTWRPIANGVALPVFAFFAAGVTVVGGVGGGSVLGSHVAVGVLVGLVVGKPLGVLGTTWLAVRLTPLRLAPGVGLRDMLPVGALTGIGFTVALLVAELSFDATTPDGAVHVAQAKIAVLVASVVSAGIASVLLRRDAARARPADVNEDGIPDDEQLP
ncbi:Na+/H+ antiporter NhaA [Luteimicrobium xylanilyticum]|uniref:Na(+)/H(+) antiporter NhaA n=1 Tax=Luteimicrobium xylanilyticum TaxID=1133546 RepID=A0A5P9Q7Z4_9MICO|nr:Na+/H+ antiporter NhaA [Luteimicrobium xylanilyticum]QFU97557.1 Na(+)/H(+) antiporter NhaA [Luteimicrobium xylanilyticum]